MNSDSVHTKNLYMKMNSDNDQIVAISSPLMRATAKSSRATRLAMAIAEEQRAAFRKVNLLKAQT